MKAPQQVSRPAPGGRGRWSVHRSSSAPRCTVPRAAPAAAAGVPSGLGVASPPLDVPSLRQRLQLHDTMARQKGPFTARQESPDRIQMYVCGVTVYDYSHIGHARVYVAFDVLYRLLRQVLQYDVQYVRNFTDIDDKIIARANERGEDPLALSARFITEYHKDMELLGCMPPSYEPKATDFIPQMVGMIETIIANGHAYAVEGGDVFFDVQSLPGYGRLSGRSQDDNRAGGSDRVDVDGRKRSPADFALWKSAKAGEPSWPSPWGPGRPGWHIECSAMIKEVMGPVIDIHGGGRDLVFPHHENELAQSQASCSCCDKGKLHKGTDFVRHWLHNGFVNVDSEKMSKSLGNFFTIRDVLGQYHPLALRWFLVQTQYRQPVNYTQRALDEASDRLYYVLQALLDVNDALTGPGGSEAAAQAEEEFTSGSGAGPAVVSAVVTALLDDMNTPAAVSELSAPLKAINDLLTTKAGKKQPDRLKVLAHHRAALVWVLSVLGLMPPSPSSSEGAAAGAADGAASTSSSTAAAVASGVPAALAQLKALALVRAGVTEEQVAEKIAARTAARAAKDFAASDRIRNELSDLGVMIMDTPQGTSWRPGLPPAKAAAAPAVAATA